MNCTVGFIGASLSEPHPVRSMVGSAMYVRVCNSTFSQQIFAVSVCHKFVNNGMHIVMRLDSMARDKMAAAREHSKFLLQSASNDHYLKRKENSSSSTLPTINDKCTKSGIQAATTMVWLCAAVSGHTSKGLAAQQEGANCSCAGIADIGCRVWVGTDFKGASWSRCKGAIALVRKDSGHSNYIFTLLT